MRNLLYVVALVLVGCAASKPLPPAVPGAEPLVGDAWFRGRAQTLGLSAAEVRARDLSLPDGTDGRAPTPGTLDTQTAQEATLLWNSQCASCHGRDGVPPAVPEGQAQPRSWVGMGPTMGFTFGGDKMRAGIYRTIAEGKGSMAGWGDALSREQIWALVAHIEAF